MNELCLALIGAAPTHMNHMLKEERQAEFIAIVKQMIETQSGILIAKRKNNSKPSGDAEFDDKLNAAFPCEYYYPLTNLKSYQIGGFSNVLFEFTSNFESSEADLDSYVLEFELETMLRVFDDFLLIPSPIKSHYSF